MGPLLALDLAQWYPHGATVCLHTFLQRGRQRRLVSSVWRPGPGSACCLVIMAGGGAGAATRGQDPARVSSTAGTMVQPQPGLGWAGLGWLAGLGCC